MSYGSGLVRLVESTAFVQGCHKASADRDSLDRLGPGEHRLEFSV